MAVSLTNSLDLDTSNPVSITTITNESPDQWKRYSIYIGNILNSNLNRIAFRYISNDQMYIYLDDIQITKSTAIIGRY